MKRFERGHTAGCLMALALAMGGCTEGIAAPDDGSVNEPSASASGAETRGTTAVAAVSAERCSGVLHAVRVEEVRVPRGATCVLQGTRVDGNVEVGAGATLEAYGAYIDGNIEAKGARRVRTAQGTFVDGNIQVAGAAAARIEATTLDGDLQVEGWGASLEAIGNSIGGNLQLKKAEGSLLRDNRVDGDIQVEESWGRVEASTNRVRGNFQVVKNRGGVVLLNNQVAQALECKENRPAPTGGGNRADEKEEQCRRL